MLEEHWEAWKKDNPDWMRKFGEAEARMRQVFTEQAMIDQVQEQRGAMPPAMRAALQVRGEADRVNPALADPTRGATPVAVTSSEAYRAYGGRIKGFGQGMSPAVAAARGEAQGIAAIDNATMQATVSATAFEMGATTQDVVAQRAQHTATVPPGQMQFPGMEAYGGQVRARTSPVTKWSHHQQDQAMLTQRLARFNQPGGVLDDIAERIDPSRVRGHGVVGTLSMGPKGAFYEGQGGGLSAERVHQATRALQGMVTGAGGPHGGSMATAGAELKLAIGKDITEWAKGLAAKLEDAGPDPRVLRMEKDVIRKQSVLMRRMFDVAHRETAGFAGSSDLAFGSGRVDVQQLQAIMGDPGHDQAAAITRQVKALGGMGGVRQGMVFGGEGGGMAYQVGAPGGGGGGRGIWGRLGGQAGGFLYGAYLAKRFWSMTAAPILQAQQQYGQMYGAVGPAAMMGQQGDWSMAGTPGGMQAQQSQMQTWLGRGAYQTFGAAMEPLQRAITGSPALGRMTAGAAMTLGTAIAPSVIGASMAMLSGSGAAGAGFAAAGMFSSVGLPIAITGGFALAGNELANLVTGEDYGLAERFTQGRRGQDVYPRLTGAGNIRGWEDPSGAPQRNIDKLVDIAGTLAEGMGLKDASAVMPGIYAAQRLVGRGITEEELQPGGQLARVFATAREQGLDPSAGVVAGASYASLRGLTMGTPEAYEMALDFAGKTVAEQDRLMGPAQRRAGLRGMFRQLFTEKSISKEALDRYVGNFDTDAQGQRAFAYASAMKSYGMRDTATMLRSVSLSTADPRSAQAIVQMAGLYTGRGQGVVAQQAARLEDLDLTPQQYGTMAAGVQGDLGAQSWMAQRGEAPASMMWQGTGGQPIYQTDWQGFMNLGMGQAAGGNLAAQQWFGGSQGTGAREFFAKQGVDVGEGLAGAWETGGGRGAARFHSQRMFGLQMAGVGLQMQGIQARQQHLWGSGAWDQPGKGSMWALQDTQRGLAQQATMAGFAGAGQRLDVGRGFAMDREALTRGRMDTQQGWQRFSTSFARGGQLMGREWKREDRQYQDTVRGLQFGWQLEDMDEGIRLSSGRQRRQLVRQRERMTLAHNLEDQQIDKGRGREETTWAREDERYNKMVEYQEHLIEMDNKQFTMSVEQREALYNMDKVDLERRINEYREMQEIQDQIIQAQRKFQAEEIERSKKSLGIQAAMAQAQKEYNDSVLVVQDSYKDTAGYVKNWSKYGDGAARNMDLVMGIMQKIAGISAYKLEQLLRLIE